jgi:hydroxymethylbilane synthase
MSKSKIIAATRQSLLAMTQSKQALAFLEKANPGISFEISPFTSMGDRVTDKPLSQFGGQGVFVKELESALQAGGADIAIHSLKDVPSEQPADLVLASFPKRENPFDVLLAVPGPTLTSLKKGARIGTGSPRRRVQLKAARPDFEFAELRGNVDTRIRKLKEGQYDAIVLAAAGMTRLGLAFPVEQVLPLSACIPAIGQGALVIECRKNDAQSYAVARAINDVNTEREVLAERAFMRRVGAGCSAPVAAFAKITGNNMTIDAMIGDFNTAKIARLRKNCRPEEYESAGTDLADEMLKLCEKEGIVV